MHLACVNERIEIIKLLLEHGADVNTKNKYNETPLDLARKSKRNGIVKILTGNVFKQDGNDKLTEDYINSFILD